MAREISELIRRLKEMADRVGAEFVPNPDKVRAKKIADMPMPELQRDLERCQKALGNTQLRPQSAAYYRRRREILIARIDANQQLKREGK